MVQGSFHESCRTGYEHIQVAGMKHVLPQSYRLPINDDNNGNTILIVILVMIAILLTVVIVVTVIYYFLCRVVWSMREG